MEWSAAIDATERDKIADTFGAYLDSPREGDAVAESTEQARAAITAAIALCNALGPPDAPVQVSIAGRATPGHAYAADDRDEQVTVSVVVHRVPASTAPPAEGEPAAAQPTTHASGPPTE